MRPSSICILLAVAVLLHHHLLSWVEASVEKACRDAANSSPNIKYHFCVAALRSYPGSGSADKKGLAVIAASLTKDKATSVSAKVKSLLAKASDKKKKQCLESCESVYEDVLSDLDTSIPAIKEGRLGDAKTYLSAAVDAPSTCEEGFEELQVPSPLTKEDSDLTQICIIALAFTNMLGFSSASLTKDKATSASDKVKALLAHTSDTKTKKCLESCESIYEDLLSDLKTSILAIKEGRLGDAKTHLNAVVDAPSTCEQGFEELKVPSPLNKEDSDLTQISTIALAFTNVLG